MFVYRDEGPLLSLLKGGRGVLRGGVEFDCLDTGKSFTLTVSGRKGPPVHGMCTDRLFNGNLHALL